MSVLLVTALYNLYPDELEDYSLSLDFRINQINELAECNIDMIVFVDPDIKHLLPIFSNKCKVIPFELDKIKTYASLKNHSDSIELPSHRSNTKDTYKYLSLMNSKIDFIELAMDIKNNFHIMHGLMLEYLKLLKIKPQESN